MHRAPFCAVGSPLTSGVPSVQGLPMVLSGKEEVGAWQSWGWCSGHQGCTLWHQMTQHLQKSGMNVPLQMVLS